MICHCSICRLCHSAPYAELLAYDNDKVRVVKGEDKMKMYNIHGKSQEDRYFCPDCGSKVYRCAAGQGGVQRGRGRVLLFGTLRW